MTSGNGGGGGVGVRGGAEGFGPAIVKGTKKIWSHIYVYVNMWYITYVCYSNVIFEKTDINQICISIGIRMYTYVYICYTYIIEY